MYWTSLRKWSEKWIMWKMSQRVCCCDLRCKRLKQAIESGSWMETQISISTQLLAWRLSSATFPQSSSADRCKSLSLFNYMVSSFHHQFIIAHQLSIGRVKISRSLWRSLSKIKTFWSLNVQFTPTNLENCFFYPWKRFKDSHYGRITSFS